MTIDRREVRWLNLANRELPPGHLHELARRAPYSSALTCLGVLGGCDDRRKNLDVVGARVCWYGDAGKVTNKRETLVLRTGYSQVGTHRQAEYLLKDW